MNWVSNDAVELYSNFGFLFSWSFYYGELSKFSKEWEEEDDEFEDEDDDEEDDEDY